MSKRGMLAGGVIAIALMAMPALGQDDTSAGEDLHSADRALVHGYDPTAMQLLWTIVTDVEADDACGLVEGQDEYTYEIDDEENVTVTGLEDTSCEFEATDVTGPEGQVNHGTVVSAFVKALEESDYEGPRGCMIRLIAQSDYGKGDQQVRVGDDVGSETPDDEPTIEFTVSETTCGKPDHAGPPEDEGRPDHAGPPEGKGPPDHAGPPSDTAPSQDEDRGRPDHAGPPAGKGNPNR